MHWQYILHPDTIWKHLHPVLYSWQVMLSLDFLLAPCPHLHDSWGWLLDWFVEVINCSSWCSSNWFTCHVPPHPCLLQNKHAASTASQAWHWKRILCTLLFSIAIYRFTLWRWPPEILERYRWPKQNFVNSLTKPVSSWLRDSSETFLLGKLVEHCA